MNAIKMYLGAEEATSITTAVPSKSAITSVLPTLASATQTHRLKFSEELQNLAMRFADRPARISELLTVTQGRGFDLLLLMMGLPFLTPIPLPGVSAPFGLVIVIVGARLALGRRPWLPEAILRREFPARFIARLLSAGGRIMRWLEILLRPRLCFLQEKVVYRRITGLLIMFSGLLMILPLPIPLTNSLPALTVVLLAAGTMERDGVFFLAGCVTFTTTLAYFALLTIGGAHFLDNLWHTMLGS